MNFLRETFTEANGTVTTSTAEESPNLNDLGTCYHSGANVDIDPQPLGTVNTIGPDIDSCLSCQILTAINPVNTPVPGSAVTADANTGSLKAMHASTPGT